jgi:hypothetical protein
VQDKVASRKPAASSRAADKVARIKPQDKAVSTKVLEQARDKAASNIRIKSNHGT